MEIGNASSHLKPLKCKKRSKRENIESKKDFQAFWKKDLLLDSKHFIPQLNQVSSWTEEMKKTIENWPSADNKGKFYQIMPRLFDMLGGKNDFERFINFFYHLDRDIDKDGDIEKIRKFNDMIISELDKVSCKMDDWETQHINREDEVSLLETFPLYLCPTCKSFISEGQFVSTDCFCGESISRSRDTEKRSFKKLNSTLYDLVNHNWHLEYAFGRLLKKLSFDSVSCGVDVLGSSGINHEIDVIAEDKSKEKRAFCECKTENINYNHLLKFNQQCEDIGVNYKIFVSTGDISSERERRFANTYNILLVDNFWNPEKGMERVKNEIEGFIRTE